MEREFVSEPIYNGKLLKTKIKSYDGEATVSYDKEMPNAGSKHIYLAVVTIDSVL